METITKTREVNYPVYIAIDGTEFQDKNECISYESTVICTLRKRLKIRKTDHWKLCYGDEYVVEIVSGEKYDMQMYLSYMTQNCHNSVRDEIDKIIRNVKKNEEIMLFFNCEDQVYFITTKEKLLERFENAYKGEK